MKSSSLFLCCALKRLLQSCAELTGRWVRVGIVIVALASSSLSYAQYPLRNNARAFEGGSRFVSETRTNGMSAYHDPNALQKQQQGVENGSIASSPSSDSRATALTVNRSRSVSDSHLSTQGAPGRLQQGARGNLDVLPQAILDTTRSSNGIAHSNGKKDKLPSNLIATNGKYDFLRVVSADKISNILVPDNGVVVVLPRKNFLMTEKVNEEDELSKKNDPSPIQKQNSSTLRNSKGNNLAIDQRSQNVTNSESASSFETLNSLKELPDDFVIFTLDNLDADEKLLLLDAKDGRWDSGDLLSASLIAEGLTTRESRAHYRSRFETLLAALEIQTADMSDQLMKTQCVYNFLHSKTLVSKYDLNCSSIAASLDSGVFNCVSATVLFNCFASRVGLEVAALETTGHAKSRVKYEDSYLDLETTCSNWESLPDHINPYSLAYINRRKAERTKGIPAAVDGFTSELAEGISREKGQEKGQVNQIGFTDLSPEVAADGKREVTGQVLFKPVVFKGEEDETPDESMASGLVREETPLTLEDGSTTFGLDKEAPLGYSFTRSRRPMREITDVELVATIYYNVGVDRYQSGDYENAVVSYIKAAQLAPNNLTILGNLKATLNNWAIDVATKEKKYSTAIRITELGLMIDPDFREFNMNMPIFFRDWIDYLAKDNKWDEIKRVQEEYWKLFPNGE